MNEFIEQFVLESRENVEQGTADLLALEKTPDDKARLDSAFRAFHTLKGGAAIVGFPAMAESVHAAEDLLSAVRSGARRITGRIIGDCLACLDQIVQWLDAIESTGDVPKDAAADANAVVRRFAASATESAGDVHPEANSLPHGWTETLLAKNPTLRARARTLVRHAPDADCFFARDDPLAFIAGLPGLLAIDLQPASAWPSLESLDPFICNLVLTAATESSPADVIAAMGDAADQCEVEEIFAEAGSGGDLALTAHAREVLRAQLALVGETNARGAAGRWASAGRVAANVLRSAGKSARAEHLAACAARTAAENNARPLREAIRFVLEDGQPRIVPAPIAVDHGAATRVLRIDASRLDALVNLTGELTVAKNAIGHVAKLAQDGGGPTAAMLRQRFAVLDSLIGELQRSVLGMRVLPLRRVFQRFPRLLRELAVDFGKPVDLLIEGGETEADKTIVEMLFEPLLHVLRNAVDHGIEPPSVRAARSKPAAATVRLCARREGDDVVVEVHDDGGGIDVARVRQVARERNMIAAEVLEAMQDEAVIDLIFEPGFSTATTVTGVSGRGVGMDAVRTSVQRAGGHVGVESRAGQGTIVRFTLPFSVMMTRVMIVAVGGQTFGIPFEAVVETLRVGPDRIVPLGAGHAIVLRHRTVPVIDLEEALGLQCAGHRVGDATIVVTKIGGHYGAVRVDRIGERMDVMLKPLEGLLAETRGLAGSTLLGDGSVLLILDIGELLQ